MKILSLFILTLLAVVVSCAQPLWMTVYYNDWCFGPPNVAPYYRVSPSEFNFNGITHVVIFGNSNVRSATWPYFGPIGGVNANDSTEYQHNFQSQNWMDSLQRYAHLKGTKVLICIQGVNGGAELQTVTNSESMTDAFAQGVAKYVERHHLDGVDVNWETSINITGTSRLVRLLRKYGNQITTGSGGRFVITLAPGSQPYNGSNVWNADTCRAYVDQINFQLYDISGTSWLPSIGSNANWSMCPLTLGTVPSGFEGSTLPLRLSTWQSKGFTASQLGAGVNSFGRRTVANNVIFGAQGGVEQDVIHSSFAQYLLNNGVGTLHFDTQRRFFYFSGPNGSTAINYRRGSIPSGSPFYYHFMPPDGFQGQNIPAEITQWVKTNGLGGVMVYDLEGDADNTIPVAQRNPIIRSFVNDIGNAPPPPSTYTITITSGAGGSTVPSTSTVTSGSNLTVNINANLGYIVSNVTVDGVSLGSISVYTFVNVTASHSLSATFQPIVIPPPTTNCDTAYQRGVKDGKASVVCPPVVVCPPFPDTVKMKADAYAQGYASGKLSVVCPVCPVCPDSALGYKKGWNDVLKLIPVSLPVPQSVNVPLPAPKP